MTGSGRKNRTRQNDRRPKPGEYEAASKHLSNHHGQRTHSTSVTALDARGRRPQHPLSRLFSVRTSHSRIRPRLNLARTVIRHDLVAALADALPNGQRMRDILDYHSSVEQAAQTATRAGVKNLVLTHYVPPMAPGQEEDWRSHASVHFDGPVILGPVLTSIEV